jgi:hypothetical protein
MRELDAAISAEIIRVCNMLPRFGESTQADFTEAPEAFAVNVTLLHDPNLQKEPNGTYALTASAQALLTQRGAGTLANKWSGVSGFIGHSYDPDQPHAAFDPIAYAARTELQEECCMTDQDLESITLHLGRRFTEPFGTRGTLHVMPLVGIWNAPEAPAITVDGQELIAAKWVPLSELVYHPDLTPGYAEFTVPHALGGLGLSLVAAREILGLQ